MRVRVSFNPMINGRWPIIRDCFIGFALDQIEEIIERPPIYRVAGRFRKSLTIYKLTEREASIIYTLLHKEIDHGIIRDVTKVNTKGEVVPAGFIFAEPDFTENEKQRIKKINDESPEESKVYRIVKAVIFSTFDAMCD